MTMPANYKLKLSKPSDVALSMTRHALYRNTICYIVTADRAVRYKEGISYIVYIGTTKRGHWRLTQSASENAEHLLGIHGVSEISFRVVQCSKRSGMKSWETLERALLLVFKRYYGSPPIANKIGNGVIEHWREDLEWFNELSLENFLKRFDKKP